MYLHSTVIRESGYVEMPKYQYAVSISKSADTACDFQALGQARTAQVRKDARIGEAEAKMMSGIGEAKAEEQRMQAKLYNDTEMARAKRDYDLKKASYDVEVNTAKAEAEMAYALQVRGLNTDSK